MKKITKLQFYKIFKFFVKYSVKIKRQAKNKKKRFQKCKADLKKKKLVYKLYKEPLKPSSK